jgi:copper chaperone NosL
MTRPSCIALCVFTAILLPACRGAEVSGPPTIRAGRDECAGCGMIIGEDLCSCAILVEDGGRRTYLLFDDLGCLLDHRSDHPDTVVVDSYVHDYATGGWARGATAQYLLAVPDKVRTPMGSGIVAFETEAQAVAEQTRSGGEVVDYERLVETRRGWREARRAPIAGSP